MPPRTGSHVELIIYYGIDPGVGGGLAATAQETNSATGVITGSRKIITCKMPESDRDLLDWFVETKRDLVASRVNRPTTTDTLIVVEKAVLEQVSGYIGNKHPGSIMFTFGASYGALRMALAARNIIHEIVNPLVWQRTMGVGNPKRTKKEKEDKVSINKAAAKREHKNKLKVKAQQLFPHLKVTNNTADALLLMEYARRYVFGGSVKQ